MDRQGPEPGAAGLRERIAAGDVTPVDAVGAAFDRMRASGAGRERQEGRR